jgi:hypothetical protein
MSFDLGRGAKQSSEQATWLADEFGQVVLDVSRLVPGFAHPCSESPLIHQRGRLEISTGLRVPGQEQKVVYCVRVSHSQRISQVTDFQSH